MDAFVTRGTSGVSPQSKKGVHIMVKLPSGTEVHEFILPVGYTVDQVKRAIFKQIPDLSNPNDYQLKLRDTLHSKEEILNVEFSKLQNLDTVKSAADADMPLELSLLSKAGAQPQRHRPGLNHSNSLRSLRESEISPRGSEHSSTGAPSRPVTSHFPRLGSGASSPVPTVSPSSSLSSRGNKSAHATDEPKNAPSEPITPSQPSVASSTSPRHRATSPSPDQSRSDARDEEFKLLQEQLQHARTEIEHLAAKLTRIGRLARLELLPIASHVPLSQLVNDAAKEDLREADIIASEKRLRSTLHLILAEVERGEGRESKVTRSSDSIASVSADDSGVSDVASRKRTLSAGATAKYGINTIAGRMNLDLPAATNLSSSSSSPSPTTSSPSAMGSDAMPSRKTLTPEQRREMLQQEFLDTEETYLKSLQKLHDFFEVPLETSGLLTPEQCDTLFSRVRKQLLEMHSHLLQLLKNRPPERSFSDTLLTIAPYLKLYTEYVNNHPEAINLLIELQSSKRFSTFLKQLEAKPELEAQDLSSFLIRPIQRLPRYELLLRDMVKYTTEETEHLKLSRLLEAVKKVNEHLNEAKRKRDNSSKLAQIQANLIGGKTKQGFSVFSSQTRNYLREDTLLVKKVKKEKTTFSKHHFFLFSDILLDTVKTKEGKYKLVQVYPLAESSVQKYEGESDTVALFRTTSPESAVEDLAKAIHVKADQGGDIDSWLGHVLSAKSSVRTADVTSSDDAVSRYSISV